MTYQVLNIKYTQCPATNGGTVSQSRQNTMTPSKPRTAAMGLFDTIIITYTKVVIVCRRNGRLKTGYNQFSYWNQDIIFPHRDVTPCCLGCRVDLQWRGETLEDAVWAWSRAEPSHHNGRPEIQYPSPTVLHQASGVGQSITGKTEWSTLPLILLSEILKGIIRLSRRRVHSDYCPRGL